MTTLSKAGKLAGDVPGLLLEAERVAQSFMKGVHGRRRVGMGESFWQFRPWQSGDAQRDIDWRQSGKTDDVFVRQAEWEASQTIWLYRDPSASMNYGGKKNYAEVLLLALGIVLLNGGEQVSLLGTALAPQTGYPAIQRVYEALATQGALGDKGRPVASRAHVIMLSDFYFPLEDFRSFCEKLAARHVTGTLVQLFHPDEETLPYGGRVKFENMEALAETLDIAQVEAIRDEYAARFSAHQSALAEMARGFGWTFQKFSTAVKPEAALTQLYNALSSHA